MIEYSGSISARTAGTKRIEECRPQGSVVVGIRKVALWRTAAACISNCPGVVEAVHGSMNDWPASRMQFARELGCKRGLARPIDSIDANSDDAIHRELQDISDDVSKYALSVGHASCSAGDCKK